MAVNIIRKFLMKKLMKPNAEGIMKIPEKGKIDFSEHFIKERLFTNGIDHRTIQNEKQLENILQSIDEAEARKLKQEADRLGLNDPSKNKFMQKPGEVIEVDFDKGRWKDMDPEKKAQGGRTGLNYLLAEDTNERMPFAGGKLAQKLIQQIIRKYKGRIDDRLLNQMLADDNPQRLAEVMATIDEALIMQQKGMKPNQIVETVRESLKRKKQAEGGITRIPFKMGRRAFLKLMGGVGAGIGALKTGLLKLTGKEGATVAKELTQVPIKSGVDGMPSWFKPLVNKVIREGEQAKVTEYDRLITHTSKLPESKTPISVHQDLNTGNVWVDIGEQTKHGWADGHYGQPVRLEYKAKEIIEPDISKTGKVKAKGGEVKEEFWVEEAEFTGGHPENVKFEESTFEKYGNHGSDFSEVERFATGKNVIKDKSGKFKEVETLPTTKKADQLEWARGRAEAEAEAAADMADDYASGGLAGLLGERTSYRVGKTVKKKKKKRKPKFSMFEIMDMNLPPEIAFEEPVNFPYKSLEDIPPKVLEMLKKDPNFDLETFLTKVGWSDSDKTRLQEKMRNKVEYGAYKGEDDEPWGLYSPRSDMSFLNYQKFGKSEPIGDGLLSIKSPSDADKVQTILHEMRHAKMKEPWFMKSSAIPKWVREYEERGEPHYLDKDIKDKHSQYRDTQKDVSGEELFVRFMDQHFGDVAEKGSLAGSDYKPYFDKILKDHWDPYAKRYKDILKEEKRVKSKPYGLASGGLAKMLGE